MWFMPFNILITFILGSALGWLLVKVTGAPQRLKGLIIGCCAAGNLGNLPLIIVPAVCREKASPFGDPDVCHSYGMAYVALSMAVGAVFLWSYVYNIVRVSSREVPKVIKANSSINQNEVTLIQVDESTEPLLDQSSEGKLASCAIESTVKAPVSEHNIVGWLTMLAQKMNLKRILAPSTIGAVVGFIVGVIPQLRILLIGSGAPLRAVQDSVSMLGDAAIPSVTLIMGGNLLRGMKGDGVEAPVIVGVIGVRYILLPIMGTLIVKGGVHLGLVQSDPLFQFVLLLQYALPPAMNIGTITQLFGTGESECSVIMLWTYSLASVALTLWSTFFMWFVVVA
uniref:Protein PIN-LIKES 3-like n=1 Tax=Kalanchoe fedtschenkoi TaxID=63787 RepID=A0A7N0TR62_KALFE